MMMMMIGAGAGWLVVVATVAAGPSGVPLRWHHAVADTAEYARTVREVLSAPRHPTMRWPLLTDAASVVESLAVRNDWQPRWTRDGRPTPAALAAIAGLQRAADWGLGGDDYDGDALATEANRLARGHADDRSVALFDVAMTVDLARLIAALHGGRVRVAGLHPGLEVGSGPLALVSVVDSVSRAPVAAAWFDVRAGPAEEDRALLGALARYRVLAADTGLRPPLFGGRTIEPGADHPAVGVLRRYLVAVGDLDRADPVEPGAETRYDGALVGAVRRFQGRHGLVVDGVIGPATTRELARPLGDRVAQLEWALERRRWLPRPLPRTVIVVNVATFQLEAVADGRERLTMAAIVGQARGHQTPVLSAQLTRAVFRPWWEVPASIMKEEIGPMAGRDSAYLARADMELWLGDQVVPATSGNVRRIGKDVRVRQRPGPLNALGGVKFLLPNRYAVFLHDTPSRALFTEARRDFSHGCVRVAEPAALARFVLQALPEWTTERIESAMTGVDPVEVAIPTPIPVFVIYQPVTIDDGAIRFAPDAYGHDAALARTLRAGYPYRLSLP